MAELLNKIPTNLTEYPNSFKRQGAFPLEAYSVFYTKAEAVAYAASNPIAYVGQTLAVVEANAEDATIVDNVTFYIIADAAGTLQEVGKATNGDDNSITLKDGVLSLTGFEAAGAATLPQKAPVYKKDAEGNDTEEVDHYELRWVAIDAIVEGDGNTKTVVEAAANSVITVTPNYNKDSDTYTYSVSIDLAEYAKTAELTAATNAITADIEAINTKIGADSTDEGAEATGLYKAIEEAEARAKAYADENDADTAYDDTAVKQSIQDLDVELTALAGVVGADNTQGLKKDIADNKAAIEAEAARAAAAEAQALTDAKAYTDTEIDGLAVAIEAKDGVDHIVLKNNAGEEIASVNASKFVQDSFLNDVAYDAESGKILFTWAMGDGSIKTDEVAVADFVQTYAAGNGLTLTGNTFAIDTGVVATSAALTALASVVDSKLDANAVDAAIDAKITAENLGQFAVAADVDEALATKVNADTYAADKATFATKEEAEALQANIDKKLDTATYNTEKADFASKSDVNAQLSAIGTQISAANTRIDDVEATIGTAATEEAEATGMYKEIADIYATKEALQATDDAATSATADIANLTSRLDGIVAQGGEPNTINTIKVNGVTQTITDKAVDINVPVIGNINVADLKDGQAFVDSVNTNTANISALGTQVSAIEVKLNNENTGLTVLNNRVTALETEVKMEATSRIDALETQVEAIISTNSTQTTDISNLKAKDTELEAEIDANTAKLAGITTTVKEYVDEKVGAVDLTPYAKTTEVSAELTALNNSLTEQIGKKANVADVYTKAEADAQFMTQAEVEAELNTLIDAANNEDTITNVKSLVEYVNENAADISQLIADVDTAEADIDAHDKLIGDNANAIAANTANITALSNTVAANTVKTSTEISATSTDGGVELGINQVDTSKLVQAEGDVLILYGGTASSAF
jgi:hypothetical protein